jgi:hypothetical protein
VPQKHATSLLLRAYPPYALTGYQSSANAKRNIRQLRKSKCEQHNADLNNVQILDDLKTICHHILRPEASRGGPRFPIDTIAYAFSILAHLALTTNVNVPDLVSASQHVKDDQTLGKQAFGCFGVLVGWPGRLTAAHVTSILDSLLRPCKTLGTRMEALKTIFAQNLARADTPALQQIVMTSIVNGFEMVTSVTTLDGSALAEIALLEPSATIFRDRFDEMILPLVRGCATSTGFAVAFLAVWGTLCSTEFEEDRVTAVYELVCDDMISQFHFEEPRESALWREQNTSRVPGATVGHSSPVMDKYARNLSTVWLWCASNHTGLSLSAYLNALTRAVKTAKPEVIYAIHLPLLRHVLEDSADHVTDIVGGGRRDAYSTILTTFLHTYVKPQPLRGGGLSRRAMNCSCQHCWPVKLLITSATQQVGRFLMSKNVRHHVHQLLDGMGFNGTHLTPIRSREPQTLVVTKKDVAAQLSKAWLARCKSAYDELRKFDAESLRKIVPNTYDQIMFMEALLMDGEPRLDFLPVRLARMRPAAAPERTVASIGRTPRATEVIDL